VRYRSAKVLIGEARLGQIGRVLQFSSCNGLEEIDGLDSSGLDAGSHH